LSILERCAACAAAAALVALPGFALAQASSAPSVAPAAATAPPTTPSPSPSPSGPSDPCTSLLALVTRPTVTTTACSVKPDALLIEIGYTNTTTSGRGGGVLANYPQAELRLGLPDKLEFDVFPPSLNEASGHPAVSGPSDVAAGLKYEIGYTSKALAGVGFVVSLPTGTRAFTSGESTYAFDFNFAYALSPNVGLSGTMAYNAGAMPETSGAVGRFSAFDPSLVLADALPDNFQVFFEGYGSTTAGPGLGSRYAIDGGLQKDIGSRLQLDLEYGDVLTVTGGLHPHAVGFGAAYLF